MRSGWVRESRDAPSHVVVFVFFVAPNYSAYLVSYSANELHK